MQAHTCPLWVVSTRRIKTNPPLHSRLTLTLSSCIEYYSITYHKIIYGHARNNIFDIHANGSKSNEVLTASKRRPDKPSRSKSLQRTSRRLASVVALCLVKTTHNSVIGFMQLELMHEQKSVMPIEEAIPSWVAMS